MLTEGVEGENSDRQ